MDATFSSADVYIESKTSLKAKIKAIDDVINALTSSALKAAGKGHVTSYMLNDGQTMIKTDYRNPQQVADAIEAFMRIKNIYLNQLGGRVKRMVDSGSWIRGRRC